jgi:hypothetical protein
LAQQLLYRQVRLRDVIFGGAPSRQQVTEENSEVIGVPDLVGKLPV